MRGLPRLLAGLSAPAAPGSLRRCPGSGAAVLRAACPPLTAGRPGACPPGGLCVLTPGWPPAVIAAVRLGGTRHTPPNRSDVVIWNSLSLHRTERGGWNEKTRAWHRRDHGGGCADSG